MLFRKATLNDAEAVSEIYDLARESLKRNGIPQWQEGVPGKESFLGDVQKENSYVIEDKGEVIATIQIVEYEPTYETVYNGAWTEDSYLVAHRVAVRIGCRQRGVGTMLLCEAEKKALESGKKALRIDTHEKNFKMRGMLEKNGYRNIGIIHLVNGDERFAYEKILKQ